MSRTVCPNPVRTHRSRARRNAELIQHLEPRLLLSTTVTIIGDLADRQVASDGTLTFPGNTAVRVGDNGTNASEVNGVFPFLLPSLPAGAVITSVSANFMLTQVANAGSVVGSCDLYALGIRTAATVLASDFFEGAYNTDTTDAVAIQQALAVKTTVPGWLTTNASASTNLISYLNSQYAAGGAGKFAFLRLGSSDPQLGSRFWGFTTADHATSKPSLSITYELTPAAPTGLTLTTTSSSTIDLAWTDNATSETNYIVERSTDGTNFAIAATLAANTTAWQDTGRAADTRYYYRVHATNNGSDSDNTTVQSDTTLPAFTRTLWVDKNYGGATKNGNFATPYTTIASAITASVAGDGIVVRNGTYYEKATLKAGTTLMSMPNELATLSGFTPVTGWTLQSGNIYTTTVNFNPTTLYVNATPQDMARTPQYGWWKAPTVTHGTDANGFAFTVITDPARLAGTPSLVGGTVQAFYDAPNAYDSAPIVAHDTVNGTITTRSTSTTSASTNNIESMANNDQYILKNTAALLDRPGEWTVAPGGVAGTYVINFWPASVGDLSSTQTRTQTGSQITVQNSANNVVIRGLEITGNTGNGIIITGSASGVTVRDNVIHQNGGNGVFVRFASNVSITNNLVLANGSTGIIASAATAVTISLNEVAYNTVDGVRAAGEAGSPSSNVYITNNYIHHHMGYSHSDGIQLYGGVSDIHILNNVVTNNGQNLMTEQVNGAELGGNIFWNASGNNVIFGHANSLNWNVHNNTIGGTGLNPWSFDGTGYTMTDNITFGQTGVSVDPAVYHGDYNFFKVSSGFVLWAIVNGGFRNFSTIADFTALSGQDSHSLSGDPLLINVPTYSSAGDGDFTRNTTTTLFLRGVGGWAVGDHIEVNNDGIVRTVTAVDTVNKSVTFDVALPSPPMPQYVHVNNWKTSTNYALDLRLQAGSPAATGSSTGGPMGSVLSIPAFLTGDFNGDGVRDVPAASAAVIAGLPNPISWAPPTY